MIGPLFISLLALVSTTFAVVPDITDHYAGPDIPDHYGGHEIIDHYAGGAKDCYKVFDVLLPS